MHIFTEMKYIRFIALGLVGFFIFASCQVQPEQPGAKYVFYFIGDGMGLAQVIATEAFLAANAPGDYEALNFRKFPYSGISTTHAANRLITGSAAAGTALATGHKTAIGRISMDTSGTIPYESIAKKAKARGMKTGIISNVSIDHATPAVFYANQRNRSMYFEIGLDLIRSDFDFFGGGGFKQAEGELDGKTVYLPDLAKENGFNYINSKAGFRALRPSDEKVIFVNPGLIAGASMLYAIDQPDDYITLAEITRKAIEYLDNDNGFFIMVEGGKIDWLCHANDISATIHEVIDFSEAVEQAINFYAQHPDETLIVVTADHETGGLALGEKSMQYESDFTVLAHQDMSGENFNTLLHKQLENSPKNEKGYRQMRELLESHFGLGNENASVPLTDEERAELKILFSEYGQNVKNEYGNYSSITVHATTSLARHAGLAWTSMSHTCVAVPVYAIGVHGAHFSGNLDNTDIPKLIWESIE